MALVVKDRVKVTTATTGTGTLTLSSAVAGFQAFSAVLSNADTTYYAIFESSTGAFEVGLGTYASPANTLARTTVLESSNAGSAVNLTAGDADVFVTQPAEKAVYLDADGYIFVSDGRNLTNLNATNLTTGTVNDARLPATISSDITGNAATATAWATERTLALTGDVTGTSAAFDGSGNITLSTTIAANSVALGTDTTGNYVATGAVSGSGLSGSASSEGATFTVTSNATNANTGSTIVFRDGSGNFSAGTITAALTGNASTATTLQTSRNIALTGAVTGNANFNGGGNISIATTATSDPVITLTGAVTGSGTMTNLGNVSITTTATADPTLTLAGDATGAATFTNLGNATLTVTVVNDSHTHDTRYYTETESDGRFVQEGGTTFGSTYPVVVRVGARNYYSNANITFTGSNNTLAVGGNITVAGSSVWTSGNDGAGSGLDADTVDGLQASQFLRSDAADSTASTISFTGDIQVGDQIFHHGDTNTYLQFHAADQFRVVTGNVERFEVNNSDVTVQSALKEKYVALSGTTPSVDVDAGGGFSLTTSGNTTFTFTAFTSALSCAFFLELTAGAGYTITWPASVEWAGGTAPDAPASGETNIYVFWSRDGGTNWYGALSIGAAA